MIWLDSSTLDVIAQAAGVLLFWDWRRVSILCVPDLEIEYYFPK
jgi:hypothetical protein